MWAWCGLKGIKIDSLLAFKNSIISHDLHNSKNEVIHVIRLVTVWLIWRRRNRAFHASKEEAGKTSSLLFRDWPNFGVLIGITCLKFFGNSGWHFQLFCDVLFRFRFCFDLCSLWAFFVICLYSSLPTSC